MIALILVIFNRDVIVLSIRFSIPVSISVGCNSEYSFSTSIGSSEGKVEADKLDCFNKVLGIWDSGR